MSEPARKFLIGVLLLLGAGGLVGWFYGHAAWGLLAAAMLALLWQVRQLLNFERALRTDDFIDFRTGEGIWEQIFSRVRFEKDQRLRYKTAYRQLLKEFRKSTNAMPDGAVILDASNEIVTCNRAAKALVGLKRKKDKGQRIDNMLRDPEISALVNSNDFDGDVEIESPINHDQCLNFRVVPYGAEQKLLLIRDVTERFRLSKMRRDFVTNASHELRSPLTVINGYLDTLAEDAEVPAVWKKPLSQMRNQGMRMSQILNEMLELSRLESSGPAGIEQSVDIADLLRRISDDFVRPEAAAEIVIVTETDASLLGIRTEIESVVSNLLSNAIRHTSVDGTITMFWRSLPEGAELIVSDTGVGIAAEDIPRLTERFFRADRGRSRDEGGIGLGLAIVKHVLARHNAELVVSSEPDSGSEFACRFPAERLVGQESSQMS